MTRVGEDIEHCSGQLLEVLISQFIRWNGSFSAWEEVLKDAIIPEVPDMLTNFKPLSDLVLVVQEVLIITTPDSHYVVPRRSSREEDNWVGRHGEFGSPTC